MKQIRWELPIIPTIFAGWKRQGYLTWSKVLSYEMKKVKTGKLVFTGTSEHCFLDRSGKMICIKKDCPELYQAMQGLIAGENE